jgi:hypothetical protein
MCVGATVTLYKIISVLFSKFLTRNNEILTLIFYISFTFTSGACCAGGNLFLKNLFLKGDGRDEHVFSSFFTFIQQ